jgi:hypothetical protein
VETAARKINPRTVRTCPSFPITARSTRPS